MRTDATFPLVSEQDWAMFHTNQSAWKAVFELCDAAKHSLEIEQYIFSGHGIGRRLLDLLTAKARQGVAVRVVADGLGSFGLTRTEGGKAFVRAGGRLRLYGTVPDLVRHPVARAHRLHRKSVICDGRHLMVGGTCYIDRMSDWRDTMIRIDGSLPPGMFAAFEQVWRCAGHRKPEDRAADGRGPAEDAARWRYMISGPPPRTEPNLCDTLLDRVSGARRSVTLTTPYLVPDRRLRNALARAVGNGARTRILMPARSDHPSLDVIGRRFAHALARRGVEMRLYEPTMIHAKLALVDDAWCSISSFNLDLFSLRLNLESGVASHSNALCAALGAQLEADLAASRRL